MQHAPELMKKSHEVCYRWYMGHIQLKFQIWDRSKSIFVEKGFRKSYSNMTKLIFPIKSNDTSRSRISFLVWLDSFPY